ncbi:MAG: LysR family transcriptional regulator [Negativicutes bacterium]|nr:LysR family transcriptional regulator [Negativicutes bacterium]
MDLLQLKYFQTVARYEHMTQAAKELHIAQPALSTLISRIEKELGCSLFNREGRNIELNASGKVFLHHVNQIFMELNNAKSKIKELSTGNDHHISLAVTNSRFLLGLLKEFLLDHPETKFRQFVAAMHEIQHHLKAGEIDFCITSMPVEGPEIECIPLVEDPILLCVPPNHRYADRGSVKLTELADDSFIFLTKNYCFQEIVNNICRQAGFTPKVIFEGDPPLAYELLQAGCGVKFISKSSSALYRNAAVFLRIEEPECSRTISLSLLKSRYLSKTAQGFKAFVIAYFAAHFADPAKVEYESKQQNSGLPPAFFGS